MRQSILKINIIFELSIKFWYYRNTWKKICVEVFYKWLASDRQTDRQTKSKTNRDFFKNKLPKKYQSQSKGINSRKIGPNDLIFWLNTQIKVINKLRSFFYGPTHISGDISLFRVKYVFLTFFSILRVKFKRKTHFWLQIRNLHRILNRIVT